MIFGTANCSTHWLWCWVFSWDIRLRVKSACVMWRWDELRRMQWRRSTSKLARTNLNQLQHWTAALNCSTELQQLFLHPSWGNELHNLLKMDLSSFDEAFFFFLSTLSISIFFYFRNKHIFEFGCGAIWTESRASLRLRKETLPWRRTEEHFQHGDVTPTSCGPSTAIYSNYQKISPTSAKWLNCLEVIGSTFRLRGVGGGGGGRRGASNQPPQNSTSGHISKVFVSARTWANLLTCKKNKKK